MGLSTLQILFQEDARKAWALDLKNNVVIVDEAHNLLETITNAHSAAVSINGLNLVQTTLKYVPDLA